MESEWGRGMWTVLHNCITFLLLPTVCTFGATVGFKNAVPLELNRISMVDILRFAMEDFHASYLTDDQMKRLNPRIRQGLFEGLVMSFS